MDDKDTRLISSIFDNLKKKKLGAALRAARAAAKAEPYLAYDEELERIERDYRLMLDYMKRGYDDPERDVVYENLLARLNVHASDMLTAYKTHHTPFYMEMARKAAGRTFTYETIKQTLEDFVADVAMLSLEAEPARTEKSKDLYRKHNDFIQALFCHIVISRQWNANDRAFFEELVLSPTIDTIDAQLMVSAVTLAAMNTADAGKFSMLTGVYAKASDEKLRQKALVGWVFALTAGTSPEISKTVADLTETDNVRNELADLQKQMIFCMNAEQDNDKIQRDIMPELMKNNNLKITRTGIIEKEDDPMQDIFDPGASERAMEKMEESFTKMMNMQKAGSDIYFGGFSQMKRYPFFYNAANWFCPFYPEHPEISGQAGKLQDTTLLSRILNNGPFCDSDKYSFALAVSSVISRLPANIREMLDSKEAFGPVMSVEEQGSPAYIRRMILQDMYRFFRLYPQRSQLANPFDANHFTFVTGEAFRGTRMSETYPELCYFMIKHKNKSALKTIVDALPQGDEPKSLLIRGIYTLDYSGNPAQAARYFKKLHDKEPDNKRALSLLARSCFESGDYAAATACYGEIYDKEPGDYAAALNYSIALSKAKRYQEATRLLYRLDIEHPDSAAVTRVLAWTLMGEGKYEQARKCYDRLLASDDAETGDWLNAGYCRWFTGNVGEAADLFKKFVKESAAGGKSRDISEELDNDKDILADHGIRGIDIRLMSDIVSDDQE